MKDIVKIVRVNNGELKITINRAFCAGMQRFSVFLLKESRYIERMERKKQEVDCDAILRRVMLEFDKLFGENACYKVFGHGVVPVEAFEEFFDKLSSLMNEWNV